MLAGAESWEWPCWRISSSSADPFGSRRWENPVPCKKDAEERLWLINWYWLSSFNVISIELNCCGYSWNLHDFLERWTWSGAPVNGVTAYGLSALMLASTSGSRMKNQGCCWKEWIFRHVFFVLLMIFSSFNYILSTCTYHVHTWKQEIDTASLQQGVPGSVARSSRHGRTLVGACSRCVIGFGALYEEPQIDVAMGYTMGCYPKLPKHILCVYT